MSGLSILFDVSAQAQVEEKNDVRVFRLCSTSPATDKLNMNSLVVEAGQFSRDSKADERRQMVEELLKEYQEPSGESNDEDKKEGIRDDLCEAMASSNDEIALYRQVDASREALTPYTQDDVPTWVKQGCGTPTLEANARRAQANSISVGLRRFWWRSVPAKSSLQKRDYAGMSDSGFLKLIGGASVGYAPVGDDDGAM